MMKILVLFCVICSLAIASADFLQALLKCHNELRQKHGVPALVLDSSLSAVAQQHANHIASINDLQHSSSRKYGENLDWGWSSKGVPPQEDSARAACKHWYAEIDKYDFNNPVFSDSTGHFTQLVWKNSAKLGGGIAAASDGGVYVVANYDPPGNYKNQFAQNVLRPTA